MVDCKTENIKALEKIINIKEKTVNELNKKLKEYTTAKNKYAVSYNRLLITTNFSEVLDGRATDASKKAYIDDGLHEELKSKNSLDSECECLKNTIRVLDDKIRLYSQAIEYLE